MQTKDMFTVSSLKIASIQCFRSELSKKVDIIFHASLGLDSDCVSRRSVHIFLM